MSDTGTQQPATEANTTFGLADPDAVALVTGAARRLGRAMSERLHKLGYRVLLHCGESRQEAEQLAKQLNTVRPDSARIIQADLHSDQAIEAMVTSMESSWGRADVLVNNASVFIPDTVLCNTDEHDDKALQKAWQSNLQINAWAPYKLSLCLKQKFTRTLGNIVNLADIYAERPLLNHTSYSASKAANVMLTKALALEMAPHVRVNSIAPGAILWPENAASKELEEYKEKLLAKIPLGRMGTPEAIASALQFILECDYLNGQTIAIDGGRSITI